MSSDTPYSDSKRALTMDEELKTTLDAIRSDLEQLRQESGTNFQAVRSQLNTIEYGVLTIAQKVLAESEVREIQSKMRRKAG
jgi:hypothetical protein